MRHLRLVENTKEHDMGERDMTVKIAFASNDRKRVNQHFGAAEAFAIFEMGETEIRLVEVAEFAKTAMSRDTTMEGHEGKLAVKVELLEGCAAVYCNAVGASAIQQLLAKGIHPMRVDEDTSIDETLSCLQKNMCNDPPVWLAKHLKKQEGENRFDENEEWQE